jgi:hypothetical protein
MTTEAQLQDLHTEIVDDFSKMCAHCNQLNGEIDAGARNELRTHIANARKSMLLALVIIDSEVMKIKEAGADPL